MKVTQKNNKYNLELDEFEARVIKTLVGHVGTVCDFGKVASEIYHGLNNITIFDEKVFIDGKAYFMPNIQIKVNKMLRIPKNCSFLYPKEGFRKDYISDISKFERRELKDAYIEDNYLCGVDKNFKKFKMDLVKHLVWAD